jgi:hypothetical protein
MTWCRQVRASTEDLRFAHGCARQLFLAVAGQRSDRGGGRASRPGAHALRCESRTRCAVVAQQHARVCQTRPRMCFAVVLIACSAFHSAGDWEIKGKAVDF